MDSQLLQIRAKKIGMKIAIARQKAGLSLEDLSGSSGIDIAELTEIEKGISCPSLPQLQYIASLIQLPLDDLVNVYALAPIPAGIVASALPKYFEIRNRMLGIQIKKNRLDQEISEEQLAQYCELQPDEVQAFESGQKAIPFLKLMKISELLHLPYELQQNEEPINPVVPQVAEEVPQEEIAVQIPAESPQPVQEVTQPEIRTTTTEIKNDYPSSFSEELRAFVSKPSNIPFLELAMKLSKMDAKKLRDIAESILEITL